jgi:CRISPR-associated protein Cmr1
MPALRFFDLDLQTVTPLLTGGVFFRPEIRAPSVRGVQRYWLRSLVGGLLGPQPALVRQVEGALFGAPQRASLIAVRATGEPAKAEIRSLLADDEFPGVKYLLYSAYQSRRDVVLAAERFQVRLQTRPLVLPEIKIQDLQLDESLAWRLALGSLWLVVHMGGIGHRMRRGAGNLECIAAADGWPETLPPLSVQAKSPQELVEAYGRGLSQLRQAFDWSPLAPVPEIPDFNILHPDTCQVYVLDRTFPTWYEALDAAGQAFKSFRLRQPDDYESVKGFLTRARQRVIHLKRAIFGLPLMFFFSSLYREMIDAGVDPRDARTRASAMVVPGRGGARPSPLWFKVTRLSGDTPAYTLQMLLMRSQFLPENVLTLRSRDRSIRPVTFSGPSDFSYIEEWLQYAGDALGPLLAVDFQ